MKHDNVIMHDAFMWNWSKLTWCDDAFFTTSCINEALINEIWWPTLEERVALGLQVQKLLGCIGFIDETLMETQKPWKNALHKSWFNGRKNIYVMNNIMICDHQGLFIYIDNNYLGSYHDVSILRHSSIYNQWCTHGDDYFEYLLKDPGYMGEKMFYYALDWTSKA